MIITSKTDVGKCRENNEDAFFCGETDFGAWAVVCDGMAGREGGEIASENTARLLADRITANMRPKMKVPSIKNMLKSAIAYANIEVLNFAKKYSNLNGMGTTVVCAVVVNDTIVIAYVGDSRAYLIGNNSIRLLTHDHSVVQELLDSGSLTKEQAQSYPKKSWITRAVGVSETGGRADFVVEDFENGQTLLLCTDGLTNFVSEEKILELSKNNDEEFSELLIKAANENGGGDNITAVSIKNI